MTKTVSACSNCHNATMKIRGDVTKYYVCGVCHRPCDPAPTNPPKPTVEGWEREFMENYGDKILELVKLDHRGSFPEGTDEEVSKVYLEGLISFIRTLLSHSVQEAKEEERERIRVMPIITDKLPLGEYSRGYQQCLSDLQQKIEEGK